MNKYLINMLSLILVVSLTRLSITQDILQRLYKIDNPGRELINNIERRGGLVNRYSPGTNAEIYLAEDLWQQLTREGLILMPVADPDEIRRDSLHQTTDPAYPPTYFGGTDYHTYDQVTLELQLPEATFPHLCRLVSIGQTIQGREMWFMKISDNPDAEEAEPQFKYISTMHGDEIVGQELMLNLIHLLLESYGNDPRITRLVDSTEIWIMPNMNFDGTNWNYNGTFHSRRTNVAGVDLNRNFPDREYGNPPYPGHNYVIQPETQNMIDFISQQNFILSANFHCGALVVNYPWDKKLPGDGGSGYYAACPDDETFIQTSLAYASYNLPMFNSPYFPNGITNGADWYEISGGMQDWNYFAHGCMEVTIEVSEADAPLYSTIPQFWDDNRESLLTYLEQVHLGIRGFVTDSLTHQALEAEITVLETGTSVQSNADFGDYYRLIAPGTYTLRFRSTGYPEKIINNVVVNSESYTILDIEMHQAERYALSGRISDLETGAGIRQALVKLSNSIFSDSTFTSNDGQFQIFGSVGWYNLQVDKEDYFPSDSTLHLYQDLVVNIALQKIYPATIYGEVQAETAGNLAGTVVYCSGKTDTLDQETHYRISGLMPGNIAVFAYLNGFTTSRVDTVLANGDSLQLNLWLASGQNQIDLDFENDPVQFSGNGDWQMGIPQSGPGYAFSGQQVWATNLTGNYSNGPQRSELVTPEFTLLGMIRPIIRFYHWFEFQNQNDGANVKISIDGGNSWEILYPMEGYPSQGLQSGTGNPLAGEAAFTGSQPFWSEVAFSLENYMNEPVARFRFDFGSDSSLTMAGWYIDAFTLLEGNATDVKNPNLKQNQSLVECTISPNPFNPATSIHLKLSQPGVVDLRIYDIRGALVRRLAKGNYTTGNHTFPWNGKNSSGKEIAAGIYILHGAVSDYYFSQKLILLK